MRHRLAFGFRCACGSLWAMDALVDDCWRHIHVMPNCCPDTAPQGTQRMFRLTTEEPRHD